MSTVKNFESKDLTTKTDAPEQNFIKVEGDVRFKFFFNLTSPLDRLRSFINRLVRYETD
jgi:hypothetical protein